MGDEVNMNLDEKTRSDRTLLPKGRRAYITSLQKGKSFTLLVLVSNWYGILGYNITYDTNDRWMFLRHLKTYLDVYASEDPHYLKNTIHYFD